MATPEDDNKVLFRIEPDPTFWAPVEIPVAGGKVLILEMEFVYRDGGAYSDYFKEMADKPVSEVIQGMVRSWKGADADYSPETLNRLLRNYPQAWRAIAKKYGEEIFGAAEKN